MVTIITIISTARLLRRGLWQLLGQFPVREFCIIPPRVIVRHRLPGLGQFIGQCAARKPCIVPLQIRGLLRQLVTQLHLVAVMVVVPEVGTVATTAVDVFRL